MLDVEHWSLLTTRSPQPWTDGLVRWDYCLENRHLADARVRAEECKALIMISTGAVEQFAEFASPDTLRKVEAVLPAFPAQPMDHLESPRETFRMLTIANRLSDEGVPEALRAYEVLRQRHGRRIRMTLVSSGVSAGYRLPEGIDLCATPLMSPELKASVYRSADVLVLPSYWDSAACYPEACAFGVPSLTTRLHHGESFVQDAVTGYLVDPPIYAYGEGYGTRWSRPKDFRAELEAKREAGELDGVVEDLLDRLELMASSEARLDEMRTRALDLHAERFSPEVRNAKLTAIYERALSQ